ncbi:permease-like cell division protein FtsX [Nonomuraea sp. MCN248]|uniref:Permease-like cell division protein FtsX n=1 Tax=Nonomuraea corallina TaxID=2989783 RepID=A0ABT4SIS7_9ACTN|nr:permease-like cell division protein FtsX [Nonomuraea corallina]MDA0637015.1 permease-like cell division protein FtsX [Nonomuraea corallina]
MEDRLRQAFAEAGATVRVETVAPLRSPARRTRPWRVAVGIAVAALLVAVVVPRFQGGAASTVAVAPAGVPAEVSVLLCLPSVVPGCDVEERVADIETTFRALPGVAEVHPEAGGGAYEGSADARHADEDLPRMFRLVARPGADVRDIARRAMLVPGVADVVIRAEPDRDLRPELTLFLCAAESAAPCDGKAATRKQKAAVSRVLKALPEVQSVTYESRQTAYANVIEQYAHNESLIAALRESDLPESYRAFLRPGIDYLVRKKLAAELRRLPGVAQVVDQRCFAGAGTQARSDSPADEIESCE